MVGADLGLTASAALSKIYGLMRSHQRQPLFLQPKQEESMILYTIFLHGVCIFMVLAGKFSSFEDFCIMMVFSVIIEFLRQAVGFFVREYKALNVYVVSKELVGFISFDHRSFSHYVYCISLFIYPFSLGKITFEGYYFDYRSIIGIVIICFIIDYIRYFVKFSKMSREKLNYEERDFFFKHSSNQLE